jgi:iron complex outermembrane receptor protein
MPHVNDYCPRKSCATALAVALTSVVNAQQAPSSNGAADQELEVIVVTGSLIKSADKVGFNQVQVITSSDIQAAGTTTVSEFLRTIGREFRQQLGR